MKYKVRIGTRNKMFYIKKKQVRTPVEWIANESEIEQIRMKISSEGILDFLIEPYNPDEKSKTNPKLTPESTVKKESGESKPKKEPTTILDKLMVEG